MAYRNDITKLSGLCEGSKVDNTVYQGYWCCGLTTDRKTKKNNNT